MSARICQYCGGTMVHERTRRVKVQGRTQPDGKPWTELLDDYRCPNCHAMLREGINRSADIWITPLFRGAV